MANIESSTGTAGPDITTSSAKTTAIAQHRESRPSSAYRPQRSRSQSPSSLSSSSNDNVLDSDAFAMFPKPAAPKRAASYPAHASLAALHHRVRIQYQDEALRERSLENVKQLLQCAAHSADAAPRTNSEILARKALKYRNVLERMRGVDVDDPTFDASAFMGVEWCKSPSPSPPPLSTSSSLSPSVRARGISTAV